MNTYLDLSEDEEQWVLNQVADMIPNFNTVDDLKQWLADHQEDDNDQPTEPTETP
ncbi:MAG: hypothetical protein ACREA2_05095 [Blastocatellia bacterium]